MLEKMKKRSVNYFEMYLEDDPTQDVFDLGHGTEHQVELNIAAAPSPYNCSSSSMTAPRCVNGHLVRPEPPSDDAPSTACNSSSVTASGGVGLGKADPPCFGTPPGIHPVPSRQLPPPPPPPASSCSSNPAGHAPVYARQWTPLNTRPKSSGGGPPDGSIMEVVGQEEETRIIQPATHPVETEVRGTIQQEEESHQEEAHQMVIQAAAAPVYLHLDLQALPDHSRQKEQDSPAEIQDLRRHIHRHLQDSVRGRHLIGQGSLCLSYCYLRTTRTAAFLTCSKCSKFGMTNPHLPLPSGEEMLNDIGLLKFSSQPEPDMTSGKALHHREQALNLHTF